VVLKIRSPIRTLMSRNGESGVSLAHSDISIDTNSPSASNEISSSNDNTDQSRTKIRKKIITIFFITVALGGGVGLVVLSILNPPILAPILGFAFLIIFFFALFQSIPPFKLNIEPSTTSSEEEDSDSEDTNEKGRKKPTKVKMCLLFCRDWLFFILLGYCFSLPGESLENFVATWVPFNFVVDVVILPVIFSFIYFGGKVIDATCNKSRRVRFLPDFVHYIFGGLFGTAFEWFWIKNAPWKSTIFQPGVWVFWSSVTFLPRVYLKHHELYKHKIAILLFLFVATGIEIGVGVRLFATNLNSPIAFQCGTLMITFNYLLISIFTMRYFRTIYLVSKNLKYVSL